MDLIQQQFQYGLTLLNFWGARGPALWDFSGYSPDINVEIGNRYFGDAQVINMAVQAKRNGDYAEALGCYLHLMGAQVQQLGHIPVNTIRAYFKVLICINEFFEAYKLISTVYCDAQNVSGANAAIKGMLQNDWLVLTRLAFSVSDYGAALSTVYTYTVNYSGSMNYRFLKTEFSIRQEMQKISNMAHSHGL